MVEMSVAGLAIDASSRTPIVLLPDPSGRRQVPIWIDHAQAHNIMAGMPNPNTKRPLTHDLMISLLKAGKLHLDSVMIHSIEESTFQAVLKLHLVPQEEIEDEKTANSLFEINARPSDAIALAVRSKCCIWMLESVVAQASIPVDPNADEEDQNEFKRFLDQVSPSALIKHLKDRESKSKDNFNSPDSESKSNQ